ncbi:hypothetical protein Tco_0676748 [Tanacetum coccineum]
MAKTVGELHVMLIEYEKGLPKKAETSQGKDKQVYITKPKNHKPYAKEHPAKDNTCHHCKQVSHCKRNYPAYLAELIKKKKKKVGTASSSDEVDINKKTENQAKMTKLSMEWKRLCKIKAKVQKCQSQSQYRRISSQTGAGTEEYYWMQS